MAAEANEKPRLPGLDYRWKGAEALRLHQAMLSSAESIRQALHEGLSSRSFESFVGAFGLSEHVIERAMGISHSTLVRRKKKGRFSELESDRLLRVAGLYALAQDVFGDRELAVEWMQEPNRGLDGHRPVDYATTEAGATEVENLLGRIIHGIAA